MLRQPDPGRISKELEPKRVMVFPFKVRPRVACHCNLAENHGRQGELRRTLGDIRRSGCDAWVLERLRSIYRTLQIRGLNFFELVREALRGKGDPAFAAPSAQPPGASRAQREPWP